MINLAILLQFGNFLLNSLKKGLLGQVIAMVTISFGLSYAGMKYVDDRHDEVTKEVSKNSEDLRLTAKAQLETSATLRVISGALQNVEKNVDYIKSDIGEVRKYIWSLERRKLEQTKRSEHGKSKIGS